MATGLGEHLAEIVEQTWPYAPHVAHTDSVAGPVRAGTGRSGDASNPGARRGATVRPGCSQDHVQDDGDGNRRVGFHWNVYDLDATIVHDLLLVDTGVYIGGLDRPELESMVSAVASHNDNVTGTVAALVNLGSQEQPDWVVRASIHRPASAMDDGQLELTVMSSAETVADLLGRSAPGA